MISAPKGRHISVDTTQMLKVGLSEKIRSTIHQDGRFHRTISRDLGLSRSALSILSNAGLSDRNSLGSKLDVLLMLGTDTGIEVTATDNRSGHVIYTEGPLWRSDFGGIDMLPRDKLAGRRTGRAARRAMSRTICRIAEDRGLSTPGMANALHILPARARALMSDDLDVHCSIDAAYNALVALGATPTLKLCYREHMPVQEPPSTASEHGSQPLSSIG